MITVLFKLLIAHAVCDFPLQGDGIGYGKNRRNPPRGVPVGQKPVAIWVHRLTAHALIHAGGVWIATGNIHFAIAELVLHWLIDWVKCENLTNPNSDQCLHLLCKIVYAILSSN
jgi:hypothetical protein